MACTFETYLKDKNLSINTIHSYVFAEKQYKERYEKLTTQNLRDYKVF